MNIKEGFITVEAMVSIILVVLFLSFGLVIIDVIQMQMLMQYSSNMTALEFSRYLNVFSALDIEHLVFNKPQNKINDIYSSLEEVVKLAKDNVSGKGAVDWEGLKEGFSQVNTNYKQVLLWLDNLDNLKEDVESFFLENGMKCLINNSGELLVEDIFRKYYEEIKISNPFISISDKYDFKGSRLFGEDGEIDLRLNYKIKVRIPLLIDYEMASSINSKTRAFISNQINQEMREDVWTNEDYWWRGKFIIAQEAQSFEYSVLNISGVHGVNHKENDFKIYRVLSFDPFRKTNTIKQFKKSLEKHLEIFTSKVASLDSIIIQNDREETQEIDVNNRIFNKILVVVIPENTEQEKRDEFNSFIKEKELEYDVKIQLKLDYGVSKYDE